MLLRSLEGATNAQAKAVRARIESAREAGKSLAVLSATVLEVAYVLESPSAGFGWDRDDIARAVEAIVDEPAFEVEHGDALRAAASQYRTRSIDLHDCLLDAVAQQRQTRVLSFDRDLHKLGHAERP
jgi:predicted nucleic-acid-binding protein